VLIALVEALVGFEAWQTLVADNGMATEDAAEIVADALAAILAPRDARPVKTRGFAKPAMASRSGRH
jgi:hypothetical protein